MKNKIKFERIVAFYCLIFTASFTLAQNVDSLSGFNYKEALAHASFLNSNKEKSDFLCWAKQRYIKQKYYEEPINLGSQNKIETIPCSNMDFENSSTSGWNVSGDVQITSGTGLDAFGGFPVVYPGGKHSLKLNNNNIVNKSNFKASASRNILVTNANNYFNLHFALAVLNFPHTEDAAAKFKIQILNSANEVLDCPKFDCYYFIDQSGGHAVGTPSFQQTPAANGINIANQNFPVSYAPWQTVGIDLTPYIGQSITVKISCDWCAYDFDWAYCYIDANCSQVNVPKYYSCGVLPANLIGPANMKNYCWIAPNGIDTVSKSINCNATLSGLYNLYCTPNLICEGLMLKYTYSTLPEIQANFICDKTKGFAPLTVNFTNTSQIYSTSTNVSSLWSYGNGISQNSNNFNTTTSTTYSAAGTYTTMLFVTKNNCVDSTLHVIEVELPSALEIPDVFTPNGDGNNDVFFLQTTTLTEINAQIFDRWGNEVFETKSNSGNIAWDGKNLKGNECAPGIYFYKINAIGFDDKLYAQKGNISIFR